METDEIIRRNTVTKQEMRGKMRRKVMSHESVSAFCLEMALLVHAGISAEDGLYLLAEDAADAKEEKC